MWTSILFSEQFGFAFEPVRSDFCGNIEVSLNIPRRRPSVCKPHFWPCEILSFQKLNRKYSENVDEHKCLKQMILIEKSQGVNFATESLLWLRRWEVLAHSNGFNFTSAPRVENCGVWNSKIIYPIRFNSAHLWFKDTSSLHIVVYGTTTPVASVFLLNDSVSVFFRGLSFMSVFLKIFLEKERQESNDENLDQILHIAYERTLKPHHGFVTRILFKVFLIKLLFSSFQFEKSRVR